MGLVDKYCNKCHKPVTNSARFCPYCGGKLVLSTSSIVLIVILSVFGLGFVSIVFPGFTNNLERVSTALSTAGDALSGKSTSTTRSESSTSKPTTTSAPTGSVSQQNAVKRAKSYLNYTSFSRDGLIKQLEYEGFSNEDAAYGADNCGADWMRQAELKARRYNESMSFSRSRLIQQLEYEGFTTEEAEHGADSVGL